MAKRESDTDKLFKRLWEVGATWVEFSKYARPITVLALLPNSSATAQGRSVNVALKRLIAELEKP